MFQLLYEWKKLVPFVCLALSYSGVSFLHWKAFVLTAGLAELALAARATPVRRMFAAALSETIRYRSY